MSDTPNPTRIESDLDATRSRLGSHLSELQDRLSPGQVLDDLMGYFRGSEGAAFGNSLLGNVRANPMPAALTGIGLAWLMAANPRAGAQPTQASASRAPDSGIRLHHYGRDDHGATMTRLREAEQGVARQPDEAEHVYSARLDTVRGQAIGLSRHTQETTESFGARVRDALASAQRAASETAHDLRDQVGGALGAASGAIGSFGAAAQGSVQNAAQNAVSGAARYAGGAFSSGGQAGGNMMAALAESPVLLGALGLAAGALLGALVPRSDQEEEALGGFARQVRDTATSLASQGLEAGQHVAQAVADKARESAQEHGLAGGKTPGQLVDAALSGTLAGSASEVAKDVLRAGEEVVRKEVAQTGGGQTAGGQPAGQKPSV